MVGIVWPGKMRRGALLVALGVGVALLACYLPTMCPTISGGDSGELATAVHTMGVAHPTGYPLYLMTGKLFDLLPWGEPAGRLAFFSALCSAAMGAVLAWLVIVLTGSLAGGLLAGLAAGLNGWVWTSATQAEVYALNLLLITAEMAALSRWQRRPTPGSVALVAAVAGLGLTHHRMSLFFSAPAVVWVLVGTRPCRARTFGWALLAGLTPLLLYLWLPWRSAHHPPIDWGNTSGSLAFFWMHVKAQQYLPYAFAAKDPLGAGSAFCRQLYGQFGIVSLVLALAGCAGLRGPRHRPVMLCLALGALLTAIWAAWYGVPDRGAFFTPVLPALALWLGMGLALLAEVASRLHFSRTLARLVRPAALLVAVFIPGTLVVQNWSVVNLHGNYRDRERAELMMAGIPRQAVVIVQGDDVSGGSLYVTYCLGRRPVPTLATAYRAVTAWALPVLPSPLREAALATVPVILHDAAAAPQALVTETRRRLEPARPLYTTIPLESPPPGWEYLVDEPISRLVAPPGVPTMPVPPGAQPLLEATARTAQVISVSLPSRAKRGRPCALDVAIRWRGNGIAPRNMVTVLLAHPSLFAESAGGNYLSLGAERPRDRLVTRVAPLLFGASLPPSPPGTCYRQRIYLMPGRQLRPGHYRVLLGLMSERGRGALRQVGHLAVD